MSLTIDLTPHENPRIDALTGAQRLRWLLAFVQQDLEALPSDALEALRDDLRHATSPAWVQDHACTNVPAADVRALQAEIRAGVHALMGDALDFKDLTHIDRGQPPAHGAWLLPEAPTYLLRVRMDRHGHRVRLFCMSPRTTDREAILMGAANLLSTYGDRLYACPECRTPFLKRYRQTYCSGRCGNNARNHRRLERQAEQRKHPRRRRAGAGETAALTAG